ncbi:kinase-like protein, partial [Ceratobasidium sp. AG-I]
WSKAKHENVLELLGIAIFREQLAMISPWMANGTLRVYIDQNPDLDRWTLCAQVADGLAYMHEIGMVHGDLKAVNILVSGEGVVKISDFGNAILRDSSLMFTDTTDFGGGTARWMSPELLMDEEGTEPADRSMPADVYALGMEVMTAKHPYSEFKYEPRVTVAVMQGIHPQRPAELSTKHIFGNEQWDILVRCWHMKPNSRPTASDVKDMVRASLKE